uniref:Secreted protein n=1 Tax=Panagrellus redivivus TaxID=6233 RepID=A0A7E4W3A2_PANRE
MKNQKDGPLMVVFVVVCLPRACNYVDAGMHSNVSTSFAFVDRRDRPSTPLTVPAFFAYYRSSDAAIDTPNDSDWPWKLLCAFRGELASKSADNPYLGMIL